MPPPLGPVAAPVTPPVQWIVQARFDEGLARTRARDCATLGATRAADAGVRVRITEMTPFWVPFWRTEVEVKGWVVRSYDHHGTDVTSFEGTDAEGALAICARRGFRWSGIGQSGNLLTSTVKIPPTGMVQRRPETEALLGGATQLDADVDWQEAEESARTTAKSLAIRGDTVASSTKAKTHAMQFVWVPVWWVDYDYDGEANPNGEGGFCFVFAAHDGTVLQEHHPSRLRAVTSRIRRLLTFDAKGLDGSGFRPRRGD